MPIKLTYRLACDDRNMDRYKIGNEGIQLLLRSVSIFRNAVGQSRPEYCRFLTVF